MSSGVKRCAHRYQRTASKITSGKMREAFDRQAKGQQIGVMSGYDRGPSPPTSGREAPLFGMRGIRTI